MASVFQSIIAALTAFIIGIFPFLDFEIKNEREKLMNGNVTIKCAAFDGNEFNKSATFVLENGVITNDVVFGNEETDSEYFLMPGLIDAHTHISSEKEIKKMIKNGVLTTCDAAAGKELVSASGVLNIHTSLTTVMPGLTDGRARVEELIAQGADYIKVMVDMPAIMGGGLIDSAVLKDMVDCAHENGLKVAAHTTTVAAVELAVDTGVDILIHVPIGEEFPRELAQKIADKDIAVVPTLVMMEAFAKSPFYGYKTSDYEDAENAVRLMHSLGVTILAGTDSNATVYVPAINHGTSLHDEMELLVKAGMTPEEVLRSATSDVAEVFGLDTGTIEEGKKSVMMLVKGNPAENITDSTEIVQIWVDGQPVL